MALTGGHTPGSTGHVNDHNLIDAALTSLSTSLTGKLDVTAAASTYAKKAVFDVRDYGAVGDGVTDNTTAFNAAISAANAFLGSDRENVTGCTILVPDGRWNLPTALTPITVSAVAIEGASREGTVLLLSAAGATFTYGDSTRTRLPLGFGLRHLRLEYLADPPAGSMVLKVDYGFEVIIDDVQTVRIGTLVQCGTSSTNIASGVTIRAVKGSVANTGQPFVNLKYGAGLMISDTAMFVRGVVPPVDPAAMTTVAGTDVINAVNANWDTVQIVNSIFERFDYGFAVTAGSGSVFQDIFVANTIFDLFAHDVAYLESQTGGVISGFHAVGCWFGSWSSNCVSILGAGYNDYHDINGVVPVAGLSAVSYSSATAMNNRFSLSIASTNRLGTSPGALSFQPGSTGFTITGCRGNDNNGAGTWRSSYGLYVGANCDNYLVTGNNLTGSSAGFNLAVNSAGSKNRLIAANTNANYATNVAITMPASNANYTNLTGTVMEVFVYGGTVSALYKNTVNIPGMTSGHIMLNPGETFAATYSVAPTATGFIQP